MNKTNVVRILELNKIRHKIFEYEFCDDEIDAVSVANKINVEHEQVFKTLIARSDKNQFFVFCIPGNYDLNLKKAARENGNKKIEMIKAKELLPLTGYMRGRCTPVGMKQKFPTFIDESAQLFDEIYVSAGMRGMQLKISPYDLLKITKAVFADLL